MTNHQCSMQLERHVDVCNKTKTMAQDRVCLGRRARTYFKKKHVTSKKTKCATNFSFKLLIDFLEVRGFSPDILTLVKKGAIGNTRFLLGSQHNNYNSVTI